MSCKEWSHQAKYFPEMRKTQVQPYEELSSFEHGLAAVEHVQHYEWRAAVAATPYSAPYI